MAKKWALSDIGDQSGKTAIITGGNTGLGLKTALELARRGATVVIGSRSHKNGENAVASVKAEIADARISCGQLDLTDHDSVNAFADAFSGQHERLDILYHNSGLVMHPVHELTPTGREVQMQINHLGHFLLTCKLMPLISKTTDARVVQSNTVPYQKGDVNLDDFDWAGRQYDQVQAYVDSRQAQLLFAAKLNQEFRAAGLSARAISMQPGLVRTEGLESAEVSGAWLMKLIAQPLEVGCRTHLRACTDLGIDPDLFWEPRFKVFGAATGRVFHPPARDADMAARLVTLSEQLTGGRLQIGT